MTSNLSLRTRLTVWYSIALLAVLVAGGLTVSWQQRRIGLARVDRELADLTATVANLMHDELTEDPVLASAAQEVQTIVSAPGRAVAILDRDGHTITASLSDLAIQAPLVGVADAAKTWTLETAAGAWRVHSEPATIEKSSMVILTATPLADVVREQRDVQEAMLIGIPIVLLLASAGGLWLASVVLRPITHMARRAASIPLTGDQDLGESERSDELGQLARAFNGLVARLRTALQTQRRFMADASHELRTPVSAIRAAAEVTLAREERPEHEYRDALSIVDAESRRVGRLVDDMLVLARADAGGYPLRPVALYLNEIVDECRRRCDSVAAEHGIVIRAKPSPDVAFRGDEDLLQRMLTNIVQNAVRHTRPGGVVSIALSNGSAIAIDVADQGPGIAPGDRERIFDRFVQLDASRRGSGAGLGLPIARWIAEAHGGSLSLVSTTPSGSTFRVVLPLTSPA